VARYAGLTGSPNASGNTKREKGLAKAGNPRVRRGLIQLAWWFIHKHPPKTQGRSSLGGVCEFGWFSPVPWQEIGDTVGGVAWKATEDTSASQARGSAPFSLQVSISV
jgi:hypothetical protein